MNEVLILLDRRIEPGESEHPDTLVVFFHESPTTPRWTVTAVVRMQGWNKLTLEQKTHTYIQPLSVFLEGVKADTHAGKYGFINFNEAVGVSDGTLQTEIAGALRSAKIQATKFHNVNFLPDARIEVIESPLPASPVAA